MFSTIDNIGADAVDLPQPGIAIPQPREAVLKAVRESSEASGVYWLMNGLSTVIACYGPVMLRLEIGPRHDHVHILGHAALRVRQQIGIEAELKHAFCPCFARELEAEDEGVDADASNPSDDGFVSILSDRGYGPARQELEAFINALDDDEKAELVALAWTGRGDYSAREWRVAVAEARARRERATSSYLLGIPLLGDYLEDGLAEFDLSCDDFNSRELG